MVNIHEGIASMNQKAKKIKMETNPTALVSKRKSSDLFRKNQLKIVKKATKLFMQQGYAQTSMRQIAKAAGIDIGNLYYFIKRKDEILFLAFDMLHSPAAELFEKRNIFDIEEPEDQLRAAIRELVSINYDFKDDILLLYRESKVLPKMFLKIIMERESRLVRHFEEILKKLATTDGFTIPNPSFIANMIVYQSSLYPLRKWNLNECPKDSLMEYTEAYIMNAIKG